MICNKKSVKQRFEEKFTKPDNGCWNWTASKYRDGYGVFTYDKKTYRAHRLAYTLYVGEIPDGLCILHRCDCPSCVNPGHLFLGTQAENMCDRENKGRGADRSGENNGNSKLTEEQVRSIKLKMMNGEKGIDVAKEFGVTSSVISNIVHHHSWKWVQ